MESFKYKGTPEQMQKVADYLLSKGYKNSNFSIVNLCEKFLRFYGTEDMQGGPPTWQFLTASMYDTIDAEPMPTSLELEIFGKTSSITGKPEGEWIENTGEQPVEDDVLVDVMLRNGDSDNELPAGRWDWSMDNVGYDITHWRLHKSGEEYFKQPKTQQVEEDCLESTKSAYISATEDGPRTFTWTNPMPEYVTMNSDEQVAEQTPRNKYMREIKPGVWVDVYDVIRAFTVTDGALQHLLKKALAVGQRGHKDALEDYKDIVASSKRALEIYEEWNK